MSAPPESFDAALDVAHERARAWLDGLDERVVRARTDAGSVAAALGRELPDGPADPADVVRLLADAAEPGLVATPSGRFFGFVIGGTLPAALAADWLVSAWDQNAALRAASPAGTAVDDIAAAWLLDVLGLPAGAGVGFVTGATMANFAGLAAARDAVLARAGWDVGAHGLSGAPRVRVLAGAERHESVDSALRYLGLGAPEPVAVDDQGRVRADELAAALAGGAGPTIVSLQAGNIHSGGFDPFAEAIPAAHAAGAWVHVDGAFGLWAGASPGTRPLVAGVEAADSWATDAHKTLNVPYDSGIVAVRDRAALREAMSYHADYLVTDTTYLEPYERVPELSRRARSVPVWAALRSLGRSGLAALVERLCGHAAAFADGIRRDVPGAEVLNDVVFTQVCLAFADDARTREVGRRLMADGAVWMTGSRWRGREVLRISVSNWSTDHTDVARGIDALARASSL